MTDINKETSTPFCFDLNAVVAPIDKKYDYISNHLERDFI